MHLLKASWAVYSFSQNCDQNWKISDALVFFSFFCRNVWYFFCGIYENNAPLCLKLCTEVASHVLFPTPQVRAELVSPIGTRFPKVTYFRTVQKSKLVRTSTCHWFTFGVWTFYYRKYSSCPFWNILRNFIWTFIARDISILPRSLVYDCILEEDGTLIWRNHMSRSIKNMMLKILQKVQKDFIFSL